jgi:hypothetical protein
VGEYAGLNFDFSLAHGSWFMFSFYWDDRPQKKGERWKNPHAHFRMGHNAAGGGELENTMSVSCTRPGYGITDCFIGNIYYGNNVDISHLMNGHSPSRIVDLNKIEPEQIWAHSCCGGVEDLEMFSESKEAKRWRKVFKDSKFIGDFVSSLSKEVGVEKVYEKAATNKKLLKAIDDQKGWLAGVVSNLELTEIYKICDKVYKNTWSKVVK